MPLHQNACIFSCAPKSKWLPFLVCVYIKMSFLLLVRVCIKMVAFPRVRLHQNVLLFIVRAQTKMFCYNRVCPHQNGCLFSCASKSKCSYILIHQFFSFLVCVYIIIFSYIRVSTSKWLLYSCAPTLKLLLFLLCACINFFSRTCVCLHQNDCRYLSAPVSKCLLVLVSTLVLFLGKCSLVHLL